MSPSSRIKRKEQSMFTPAERNKIVQIIIEQKAFGEVKSIVFWKGIQREFPNHGWYSLRNHYLRTIVPQLHNYNVAPEILKCLREGASPALESSVTRNLANISSPSAVGTSETVPEMKNVQTQTNPVIFIPMSEITPDFEIVLFKRLLIVFKEVALEMVKLLPHLQRYLP